MDLGIIARSAWRQVQGSASESLYLRTGIDTTAPTTIKATINERCNYKCHYCNFWQQDFYKDEMSIDDWKGALLSLKDFIGPYLIQFSGGEPFMKKGFIDLLGVCRDHQISWGVITNGSAFSQKIITRVVDAKPTNIDISIDSPDPDANDFVRGAPGSFLKIEKAIGFLREERERLGHDFPIRIKTVVHRLNFRDLLRMVDWARAAGADTIDFSPVHPIAKRYWTEELEKELWIFGSELDELDRVIEELAARIENDRMIENNVERVRSWAAHFRKEHIPLGLSPCRVGMRDYHIKSDGNVSVCSVYQPIGNVRRQSAQEIWYSEAARRIRERTTECTYFGENHCASSCLSHRSLKEDARRALRVLRQVAEH